MKYKLKDLIRDSMEYNHDKVRINCKTQDDALRLMKAILKIEPNMTFYSGKDIIKQNRWHKGKEHTYYTLDEGKLLFGNTHKKSDEYIYIESSAVLNTRRQRPKRKKS